MKALYVIAAVCVLTVVNAAGNITITTDSTIEPTEESTTVVTNLTSDSTSGVHNESTTTSSSNTTITSAIADTSIEVTTMPTTTKPTTAPLPSKPPVGHYSVKNLNDNKTCIMANMGVRFTFNYTTTTKQGSNVVKYDVVNVTKVSGSCKNSSEILTIDFNENWQLQLTFSKKGDNFQVSEFKFTAESMNPDLFPDVKNNQTKIDARNTKAFGNCKVGNSYECNAEQTLDLEGYHKKAFSSITMEVVNVQLQAFMDGDAKFGDAQECKADVETSNLVPIIVGAVLAALVVIVLVAYIITRNRSQRGYESV